MPVHRMGVSGQIQALAAFSLGTELPYALEFICICNKLSRSVRNYKIEKAAFLNV
jgi:hypothetical protein